MRQATAAIIVALAVVTSACGANLSDAETEWCTANSQSVLRRAEMLGTKGTYDALARASSPSEAFGEFLATRQGSDACKAAYRTR